MFTLKKEQGFIIRKNRKIQSQRQDRKKFMSQTDFFNKNQLTPQNRSPGSILRLRFKEDIGVIKSTNWNILDNNGNPQQSRFKVDNNERGNQFDQNSFDEFQINSKSIIFGVDVQGSIEMYEILKRLNQNLHNRSSSADVLPHIKQYFDFTNHHELIDMSALQVPPFRKKILKQSIFYEKMSLLIISYIEAFDLFLNNRSFVINLINYTFDNMLLRLAILTKGQNVSINEILESEKKENFSKKGYDKIKNNNEIIFQAIFKLAKNDNLLYENLKKMIKIGKGVQVKEHFKTILQYFAFFLCASQKDHKVPFMAVAPSPFLPQQQVHKYTLVIDILEVCCNKNKKSPQMFRPYAEYFLNQMSKYYEIVSLCDAMPNEVHKYLIPLNKKENIKHKLFRYHLDKSKSVSGKDLTKLGRKISEVVVLDTSLEDDKNTIVLNSWKGKKNDAQLAQICPLLAMIAVKKLNTVKAIRKVKEKMNENQKLGLKYLNCGFDLQ